MYIYDEHPSEFLLEWEIIHKQVAGKVKILILRSVTFFSENRVIYEVMWKNMKMSERPQMTL